MRKNLVVASLVLLTLASWQALRIADVHAQGPTGWLQWGRNAQHNGDSPAIGQTPQTQLADITYDPFATLEKAETGDELLEHYQVPLIQGNSVFMEYKTGVYTSCNPQGSGTPYPCGPDAWDKEIWNERAFVWQNGSLVEKWNFQSDWTPEPNSNVNDSGAGAGLGGWEPVFHAVVSGANVYVPGVAGSLYKLNPANGSVVSHFTPFGNDTNTYISGPLMADPGGNIFYNTITLNTSFPWTEDINDANLVKITPAGVVSRVDYKQLLTVTQTQCSGSPCGSQRPAINVAPAISQDGKTLYNVSRAHFASGLSFLFAVNTSSLTTKWQVQLANQAGQGNTLLVTDQASSSPVVTPDGSVLFGAQNTSSTFRGSLVKFSSTGQFLATYNFGWDITPAIYPHGTTYSVILKDNHYSTAGPYFITQLDANLHSEWQYKNPTKDILHPNGYEWCVNAPAVDANGTVYANSEDGNVYVINQGGTLKSKMFLRTSIDAAYTPLALGPDGKLYTENDGDMFVLGN